MAAVQFTPWLFVAGLGSFVTGAVYVLLTLLQHAGGGVRTLFNALRQRPASVCTIVVIDIIGGILVAGLAIVLGITQPQIVAMIDRNAFAGWFALGVIGPFFAGRLFTGSVVRNRFRGWIGEVSDVDAQSSGPEYKLWHSRSEAVFELQSRCWILVQRNLGLEAKRLRTARDNCVAAKDLDTMREVVRCCQGMRRRNDKSLSSDVSDALDRARTVGMSKQNELSQISTLIEVLIETQTWDPLYVVFGAQ